MQVTQLHAPQPSQHTDESVQIETFYFTLKYSTGVIFRQLQVSAGKIIRVEIDHLPAVETSTR